MSICPRCRARSIWPPAAAPRSRSTRRSPRDAYRVLGYRQCGERAVRVDILERLADLIRPALAWRESSPGEKPTGAFDGRGFVVTQAMTSLTGSAGEDFASILRALGYRMDKPPAVAAEAGAGGSGRDGRPAEAAAEWKACRRRRRRRRRLKPRQIAAETAAGHRSAVDVRRSRAVGGLAARSFTPAPARAKRLRLPLRLRRSKPRQSRHRRKRRSKRQRRRRRSPGCGRPPRSKRQLKRLTRR